MHAIPRYITSKHPFHLHKKFFARSQQANSTSQSVFLEFFGMTISSLGPINAVVDLKNMMGSAGIDAPVSLAWSA
jgi:hypothetical protein